MNQYGKYTSASLENNCSRTRPSIFSAFLRFPLRTHRILYPRHSVCIDLPSLKVVLRSRAILRTKLNRTTGRLESTCSSLHGLPRLQQPMGLDIRLSCASLANKHNTISIPSHTAHYCICSPWLDWQGCPQATASFLVSVDQDS